MKPMGVQIREKTPGSGVWWVFVSRGGRRKSRRIGSKKDAADVANRIRARLLGTDDNAESPVFEDYARGWLDRYADRLKRSTAISYRVAVLNHAIPAFRGRHLHEIARADVVAFVDRLRAGGLAAKTVANYLVPVREMLAHAVRDEILVRNPAAGVAVFARGERRRSREQIQALSSAELGRLLAVAADRWPGRSTLLLLAAHTGMRLGEALALRWGDLHTDGGERAMIRIARTLYRKGFSLPKSGRVRVVDVSAALASALMAMRDRREGERAAVGLPLDPAELVFRGERSQPLGSTTVLQFLHRACAAAGVKTIRFHDLRHSYASILLYEFHAPIQYVSAQLGHSSISITVDIYGHPRPGLGAEILNRLPGSGCCTQLHPDGRVHRQAIDNAGVIGGRYGDRTHGVDEGNQ